MKEEKDKLSRSFKDKLADYSEEVNNSLWVNIQADIKRSKMLKLRHYYMSAASVVVLLGILAGVLIFSQAPISRISPIIEDSRLIGNSTNSTVRVVEAKTNPTEELLAVLDGRKRESIIELREKSIRPGITLRNTIRKESSPSDIDSNQGLTLEEVEEIIEEMTEEKETAKRKCLPGSTSASRELLWGIEEEVLPKSRSSRKLKLSFMGAGAFADNKSSASQGVLSLEMLDEVSQSYSDYSILGEDASTAMVNNRTNYNNYKYQYNLPFSFGVSIRKELPKGFSLETGVFATMLSTTFLPKSDSDKSVGKNTMWYVGVPIKASWDFFSTGIWSLYISAGAAVEKCISSQYIGDKLYLHDLTVNSSADVLARDFAFQFSANASIGLQAKLSDLVGLFFEPGVSYYFGAKAPIPTSRTDRPFNVNLQAGLRFNL